MKANERVPSLRENATTSCSASTAVRRQLYCLGGAKRVKIAPQPRGNPGTSVLKRLLPEHATPERCVEVTF